MKITAHIKPNSRVEKVEHCEDGTYLVRVREPASEGRANKRTIELLSKHFNIPKSQIELLSGKKGRRKVFHLDISKDS